jgi:hypothetical protein
MLKVDPGIAKFFPLAFECGIVVKVFNVGRFLFCYANNKSGQKKYCYSFGQQFLPIAT